MGSMIAALEAWARARHVRTFLDFLNRQVPLAFVLCVAGLYRGGVAGGAAFAAGCIWLLLVIAIATASEHGWLARRRAMKAAARKDRGES